MKTIVLTTALITAIAAPVFAGDVQLERQLRVEPGVYSTAQLISLAVADTDTTNEGRAYFGEASATTLSTSNITSVAADIHAALHAEVDGNEGRPLVAHNIAPLDNGGVNAASAAVFAQLDTLSDGPNS